MKKCKYFVDDTNRDLLNVLLIQIFTLKDGPKLKGLCGTGFTNKIGGATVQGRDGKWYAPCPCRGDKESKDCKIHMNLF